jgi:hypothetical protein
MDGHYCSLCPFRAETERGVKVHINLIHVPNDRRHEE